MPDFVKQELDGCSKTSYMSTGKINEARIFKCKFSEKKCQVTLIQKNRKNCTAAVVIPIRMDCNEKEKNYIRPSIDSKIQKM